MDVDYIGNMVANNEDKRPHYSFEQDFPSAYEEERNVAGILSEVFGGTTEEGSTAAWDIRLHLPNGNTKTFEVKDQISSGRTGNIVIEFECRGEPSGIVLSHADYYVNIIYTDEGKGYYLIPKDRLEELIDEGRFKRIVVGGDAGSNSKCYLFGAQFIIRQSVRLDDKR